MKYDKATTKIIDLGEEEILTADDLPEEVPGEGTPAQEYIPEEETAGAPEAG